MAIINISKITIVLLIFASTLMCFRRQDAGNSKFLGKFAIYERAEDVWFVGEINEEDKQKKGMSSGNRFKQSSIIVVSCSNSGLCQLQCLEAKPSHNWLPLLTWENDIPILLSKDLKTGITMGSSERRELPTSDLEEIEAAEVVREWNMLGGTIPQCIIERNRTKFGVKHEVSSSGLGFVSKETVDLTAWKVDLGEKDNSGRQGVVFRSSNKTTPMEIGFSIRF